MFIDKLAPILTQVYKESFSVGKLPNTFNEALISLIVKKDKDPSDPSNYNPFRNSFVEWLYQIGKYNFFLIQEQL